MQAHFEFGKRLSNSPNSSDCTSRCLFLQTSFLHALLTSHWSPAVLACSPSHQLDSRRATQCTSGLHMNPLITYLNISLRSNSITSAHHLRQPLAANIVTSLQQVSRTLRDTGGKAPGSFTFALANFSDMQCETDRVMEGCHNTCCN